MLKMLDGRMVQYIRLHYFSSQATRQFTQAMQAGERQQVTGYVIDLRNNPGDAAHISIARRYWQQVAGSVTMRVL